jgi:alkaline phosphatase
MFLAIMAAMSLLLVAASAQAWFPHHPKPRPWHHGHHWNKAPKNIIVMISDGCGYNHVDAASLYQYGRTGSQVYERFPVKMGLAHYMVPGGYDPDMAWDYFDYVTYGATDSAAAATAMSSGVRTYSGSIGMDIQGNPVTHLIQVLEESGRATGVITSVEWSHATPAGYVAHNASRNNYEDIAKEMIYDSAVDVIMGCGHPYYNADGEELSSPNTFKYVGGEDTWNDLVAGTAASDADGDGVDDPWTLVQTVDEFRALASGDTPDRVCGTAKVYQTLQYNRSGDVQADPYVVDPIDTVPTLEEMTQAALNVLDDDPDGFFLMVEGGAVDWAGHGNALGRLIEEEIDFNRAVEAVVAWIQANRAWNDTVLIVTGDHETGYLTGPDSGQTEDGPVWNKLTNNGAGNAPGAEWHSGDHTNSLIPLYIAGYKAEKFLRAAEGKDPVRGYYLNNTDLANVLFEMLD